MQRKDIEENPLDPRTDVGAGDATTEDFIKSLLERAPDLMLDAQDLRKLKPERRDKLEKAVDLWLKGGVLTKSQCVLLKECARNSEDFYPGTASSSSESEQGETKGDDGDDNSQEDSNSQEEEEKEEEVEEGAKRARRATPAALGRKRGRVGTLNDYFNKKVRTADPSKEGGGGKEEGEETGAKYQRKEKGRKQERRGKGEKEKREGRTEKRERKGRKQVQDRKERKQERVQDRKGRKHERVQERKVRKQDREGRKQEQDRGGRKQKDEREGRKRPRRQKEQPASDRTPLAHFCQQYDALRCCTGPRRSLRKFAREPTPMAPVVCLFCDSDEGGDFSCEKDLRDHVAVKHGGMQHYRHNVFGLLAQQPPFVGGQLQRAVVRNFSEFLARGNLGWNRFTPQMRKAAESEEGLAAEERWEPRSWVACVFCTLQGWSETRLTVKIAGEPCPTDADGKLISCEHICRQHCFFRDPDLVAKLLNPTVYTDEDHWHWLPRDEVFASCPVVNLPKIRKPGEQQTAFEPRRLLMHKRRVSEAACAGDGHVRVCRPCYNALRAKTPRMSVNMLANGYWLGRHPEILRQMPFAHRLLLPTARVIAQRAVFGAQEGHDWEKAFKQKGMAGVVLVVSQAPVQRQIFKYPPKDLGESFQALFVGVDPDDHTKGLLATVTKELFEAQVQLLQEHNLVVKEYSTFDGEEVAKWSARQEIEAITNKFHASEKDEEETTDAKKMEKDTNTVESKGETMRIGEAARMPPEHTIGETKLPGPADATEAAQATGEAAENLPYVSLPDTATECENDPRALVAIAVEKQAIMREQAQRIQYNEARSGHGMKDEVGKQVLREQAQEWKDQVGKLQATSAKDVVRRCGAALGESTLVVPTQDKFLRMYDWDFWCRWNPMDWCYGDAVYNDQRREIAPTYDEFCQNMLLREEMEYDLYPGENYQAEHYGEDHWHLRCNVDVLLERHRQAEKGRKQKREQDRREESGGLDTARCGAALFTGAAAEDHSRKPLDASKEFFHVNRFRRWWLNLHVLGSFWRMLSSFQAVTVALRQQGMQTRLKEAAGMDVEMIAAAQGEEGAAADGRQAKATQAIRNIMATFQMAIGTAVGSDGYRVQNRHAGQAYTGLWGPSITFMTPNLADTKNVTLLLVQGEQIDLEDEGGDVIEYAKLRLRLVHDPVGQAIMFELYMRLFYLFVLGVRPDAVAQPRGAGYYTVPEEWCPDGVACSVLVVGAWGALLALRGEIEASGRGSLHAHIIAWLLTQCLRDRVQYLFQDRKTFKKNLRAWIRAWVNAVHSMHHSSVANLPRLFADEAQRGELPAVTHDLLGRTRMDGGTDNIPGYKPIQRAQICPKSEELPKLGSDYPYLPEGIAPDSGSLQGGTCSSFPAYRRQKKIYMVMRPSEGTVDDAELEKVKLRRVASELSASCWAQRYVKDARLIQNRTMLHKCGPSCWKYASEKDPRLCRHQVYHFIDLTPEEGTDNKKKCVRREGRQLVHVEYIIEEHAGGNRGRLKHLQEHPTETTTNYAGAVCMRCNLDNQTLCRFPVTSIFDAGPFSTLGPRPLWGNMQQEIPAGSTTSLVLPDADFVPIWSVSATAEGQKQQDSTASDIVLPIAEDVEMSTAQDIPSLGCDSRLRVESAGATSAIDAYDEDEKLFQEIARESDLLFQDALNAGYYINEYTTKVQVLGEKLLQGMRKAAEKRRDQQSMEDCSASSKELNPSAKRKKEAAANFYKLVYVVNNLQIKSGAEMAFPILFGHMSFSTHRTWEMNMRYPTFLMWRSWEKYHGKAISNLRKDKEFRHNLNIFLPRECEAGKDLPSGWLVLALETKEENEEPQHCFISPKGKRFTTKDSALRHADAEKKGQRYENVCSESAMNDVNMNDAEGDKPAEDPNADMDKEAKGEGDQPAEDPHAETAALTFASSNYFDDWLHRGWFE